MKLDRIDIKILHVLQQNGRMKNVELSEVVNLSPSPCLMRVVRTVDVRRDGDPTCMLLKSTSICGACK
ncbi:hypothetical protein AB395_00006395 (plasmid) [Sinorhizobium fredii CCBAU 45436]|nr:hypothetical protein AB395_00006395 [Sinorhizobium fredii CCBAU 45436]